jgi:hypothetical protein
MDKFEKKLAAVISTVLHPVIMPLAGFVVILYSGTYPGNMEPGTKINLIMLVAGLTVILPLIFIPLYLYVRIIRELTMDNRRERLVPMYITLACYLFSFMLLRNMPLNNIYNNFMVGVCLTLLLVILVSMFWKISMHMAGLGGIVALVLFLSLGLNSDLMVYLVLSILAGGLAGYARLITGAHTPAQVYCGFALGFATIGLSMLV